MQILCCGMHLQALDVLLRVALRAVQDADVLLRLQQQPLGFRQALLGCLKLASKALGPA